MSWIFYALLAPATYAVVTFIDKYLLEKQLKDYSALPIYTAQVAFVAGLLFWTFTGFPLLALQDTLIILTTGILTGLSLFTYVKALSSENTSTVTVLMQMFPIFSLLLSFFILKETITILQFLGFFLVLIGTIGISLKKTKKKFNISKAFFWMLLFDLLWATAGILMKFAINENSFSKVLSFESFGIAIGGILLFCFLPEVRNAFLKERKRIKAKGLSIIALNEGVFVLAKTTTFYAFSVGPGVALVSILEGTQTFFAIAYGLLLSILFPTIFHEETSKKGILKNILYALLAFMGTFLIIR